MFDNFSKFLGILVDSSHKHYEAAWREFEKRYQSLLLNKVHRMKPDAEFVGDVLGEFSQKLVKRDFHAIKIFRHWDSENAFRVYLLRIIHNIALAHLRGRNAYFDISSIAIEGVSEPDPQQAFELLVTAARNVFDGTKKKPFEIERDIFVFLLRTIVDLSSKEIAEIPLLQIQPRDVDNIVYRLKERFTEKGVNLRDFVP